MTPIVLPLLLMIIIIVGLVVFNNRTTKKPLTYQKSRWIFIGYILILIIGIAFAPLLPTTNAKQPNNSEFDDFYILSQSQYTELLDGGFTDIYQDNVDETWSFTYSRDSLFLDAVNFDGIVLIERTKDLQDKIEVNFIKDYAVMEVGAVMIDISEYQPDMTADLNTDVLLLQGPANEREVRLALTEPEFTISQFLDNKVGEGYSYSGSHFFYIRVPQELHVSYSDYLLVDFVKN
ncbi:hypothetical protein [Ornithinibacillus halotolerans]|uniref:Uncharacterized protein n=1 Tax=Ornithinibacillus halotolerans TaxID=1274357 RepID=A0A916S1U0_9BACI|nr:hypothetical protein [Ornithinibacillus halotolerans]GGA77789.1 hypothetical protein GCM10008025_21590 [Ornithinibacillus halotolerans]